MDIALNTAKTIYKEYIDSTNHAYYKDDDNIIIFELINDDMYHMSTNINSYDTLDAMWLPNLKVVLLFDMTDPYKLVTDSGTYKIGECIYSCCYKKMEQAYKLYQTYWNGTIMLEWKKTIGTFV